MTKESLASLFAVILPIYILVLTTSSLWPVFQGGRHRILQQSLLWIPVVFLTATVMRVFGIPNGLLLVLAVVVPSFGIGQFIVFFVTRRRRAD